MSHAARNHRNHKALNHKEHEAHKDQSIFVSFVSLVVQFFVVRLVVLV